MILNKWLKLTLGCLGFLLLFNINHLNIRANARNASVTNQCADIGFKQAPEFITGNSPKAVAAGDFDNDGRTDVVAVFSSATYGFSILRNIGTNQFAPKQDFILSPNSPPSSIFVKDLDADGKADLIVTYDFDKKISVFRNTSSGVGTISFASKTDYTVGGEQARKVAFGDVDGDGSVDVITANADVAYGISVLRNVSAGTGNISLSPKIDFPVSGPARVVIASDFDGDGKLDIATGGSGTSRNIVILRNTGSGVGNINFSTLSSYNIPGEARSILAVDFDADGKPDIATANALNDNISVLRNTGSGMGNISFASAQNFAVGAAADGLVSADFDGDGKIDVATSNQNGNSVTIRRNTSSSPGVVSFAPRPWDFGAGAGPYGLATGDFNADGKEDIVTANLNTPIGNTVSVLINSGNGAGTIDFVARKDYLTLNRSGVSNIVSGDFDQDGYLDLAVSLDETNNVFKFSVYRNDGKGHFPNRVDLSPTASPITSIEPYFISAGDFDQDGRTDLAIVADWYDDSVSQTMSGLLVFKNISTGQGNISFAPASFAAKFLFPVRVFVTDLDNDGKKDIIATHKADLGANDTALFFRNAGGGDGSISFSQIGSLNLPGRGVKISFADLDLDNKTDLVYLGSGSYSYIIVQHNTASGSGQINFTKHDIIAEQVGLGSPVIGDIDGDGKEDLIAEGESAKMSVFRNTSTPGVLSFASRVNFPNLFQPPSVAADLNNDGKKDVILSNNSFFSVLKNLSPGDGAINFSQSPYSAFGGNNNGSGNRHTIIVGNFDNKGNPDIVSGFFSFSTGTISVLLNQECLSASKTPYDFDGDGKADVSVFRPTDGAWYLNRSSEGFAATQFGISTDKLVPADYDGDGKTDVGVFRDGGWYLLRSTDGFAAVSFGQAGDIPQPADFDGDGKAELVVYRPSAGSWYVLNLVNNQFNAVQFGISSDKPVVGDYDGDGKADYAVYRPENGAWYLLQSTSGFAGVQFGIGTDKPVPADYDGDGKTDLAVYRDGNWYLLQSTKGFLGFQFGIATDVPSPADYDGDGKADAGVFRNGNWYLSGSTNGFAAVQFGQANDKPVPNAFVQ